MNIASRALVITSTILITVLASIYFKNKTERIFLTDEQNPHQTLIKKLPVFELNDLKAKKKFSSATDLNSGSDKLLLVHFWGTWCAPCEAELPSLLKFVKALDPYPILFIFIAVKDNVKDLKKYLAKLPQYPDSIIQLYDSTEEIMSLFGMSKVPETFIFSLQDKSLLKHYVGPQNWNNVYYQREILNL